MSMSLFEAAKAVLIDDYQDDLEDPIGHHKREKAGFKRISHNTVERLIAALSAQQAAWRERREASEHVTPYEIGPENEMCAKRKTTGVYEYLGPADEIAVWNEYFGYSADGKRDLLEER